MLQQDFNIKYCFIEFVDEKQGYRLELFPVDDNNIGAMNTTFPDGKKLGGEYSIANKNDGFHILWYQSDFLFIPTELGFDLISDFNTMTVAYSFARPVG